MAKEETPLEEPETPINPFGEGDEPVSTKSNSIKNLLKPLSVRILLSCTLLLFLAWLGLSMCSSPMMPRMLKNRYNIALDPSWYPLALTNKEQNMTAFCDTLLTKIGDETNLNINVYHVSTSDLFPKLAADRYDGIVTSRMPPPLEIDRYLISNPIYRLGQVLVVSMKSPVTSLTDMKGKVIGLVEDAQFSIPIDKYPAAIFRGYLNAAQAFADLDSNRIDGMVINTVMARIYTQGLFSNRFRIISPPLTDEAISLILHKKDEDDKFLDLFNKALQKFRDDGTYKALLKEWQLLKD